MTRREIILQVLCEHAKDSQDFFDWALDLLCQENQDAAQELDVELSDEAGKELIGQIQNDIKDMEILFSKLATAKNKSVKHSKTVILPLLPGTSLH